MRRLTGTDALFLSMETPAWHQHVGGLTVLEPGPNGLSFEGIVAAIAERIPLAPKFTWKLKEAPMGLDRPVWVDDEDFDVRRHIRRVGVPAPGGPKEAGEVAGTLLSTQLDRNRPLWEIWVLEGLAHGRTGLLMKYHHCLSDGVSGASLATALMDLEAEPTASLLAPPSPEESEAGTANDLALLAGSIGRVLGAPARIGRFALGAAGKGVTMANTLRRDTRTRSVLRAPTTSFNAPIGPRRELSFASVALADVRKLKEAHGVKVNDVVLALCGSALRAYLLGRDELPEEPLVSGVPVSTRAEGDMTQNNQISTMFVSLATNVADPVERLMEIHQSSQSAKEMTKALSARQIQSIGEVASPLLLATAVRAVYRGQLMSRSPVRINTVVSNVPGPPMPLYMCGAQITGIFPSSVILEGMGINLTVVSYVDRVDFGIHVDPDLVPNPWAISDGIAGALAELMTASGLGAPSPVVDPFDPPVTAAVEDAPEPSAAPS
jgi:diacylglycerol O-acyltransferase